MGTLGGLRPTKSHAEGQEETGASGPDAQGRVGGSEHVRMNEHIHANIRTPKRGRSPIRVAPECRSREEYGVENNILKSYTDRTRNMP